MKNSFAFTLAEVLITLTIIGVIAAMTIPNLVQSYKKHQVEVGVKEAYSILSNAIKMSETENGSASDWDTSVGSSNISTPQNIIPYLKVTRNCGYAGASDTLYTSCLNPIKALDGSNFYYNGGAIYKAILSNGMSIGICPITGAIILFIDINGKDKGNSVLGEDVFAFSIFNNNYFNTNINFWAGTPRHGYNQAVNVTRNIENLTDNSLSGNCSYEASSSNTMPNGIQCAAVIAKNGWKIPDDYPIKKW